MSLLALRVIAQVEVILARAVEGYMLVPDVHLITQWHIQLSATRALA